MIVPANPWGAPCKATKSTCTIVANVPCIVRAPIVSCRRSDASQWPMHSGRPPRNNGIICTGTHSDTGPASVWPQLPLIHHAQCDHCGPWHHLYGSPSSHISVASAAIHHAQCDHCRPWHHLYGSPSSHVSVASDRCHPPPEARPAWRSNCTELN